MKSNVICEVSVLVMTLEQNFICRPVEQYNELVDVCLLVSVSNVINTIYK